MEKIISVIQVCYSLSESKTYEREIKSLLSCLDELKLKEGIIITKDTKKKEKIKGKTIRFIPIWEYLLNDQIHNFEKFIF